MQMSRREFGTSLAAGLAVLAGPVAARQGRVSAEDARATYGRVVSIDALANPGSMNVPWPPRGPLTQAQREHIAKSGLTAINVTVSADDFEGTVENIALWTGEAARYPQLLSIVRRHDDIAPRQARADPRPHPRLPEHRDARARSLAARHVPAARRAHHPAHLQQPQPDWRRVPRARRRRDQRVRTRGRGSHERAGHRRGPEPLRHPHDRHRHRREHQAAAHHALRLPRGLSPSAQQGRPRAEGHGRQGRRARHLPDAVPGRRSGPGQGLDRATQ